MDFIPRILLYQYAEQKLCESVKDGKEGITKIEEYYQQEGEDLEEIAKKYSIRIYFVKIIKNTDKEKEAEITCISNKGIPLNKNKAVRWRFKGKYEGTNIEIRTIDKKDITYHIWEVLEFLLEKENKNVIEDLEFELSVQTKDNKPFGEKQKLILFFSKKGNWGRLWTYDEARKEMRKAGLAMRGRGIEGERPREFRYDLGYPFITSEQDKDVPDGSFRMDFPFPNQPRNERRNATINLEKSDWTELLKILKKEPKKLRCFECGLFEGETNKIGQKTKFEKGHLKAHLSGGDVSKENITAICKYCNSKQKDIYSYDAVTGKKVFHIIPFLKNRNYKDKKEALKYLMRHLKKVDVERIAKEILE